ncbi:MAG: zinc ABC transporter substrate-binding protein [Clostridiales bacterium]|nr:zinc ABC transporter substrate-binding protein [Clostridiales bacterium]
MNRQRFFRPFPAVLCACALALFSGCVRVMPYPTDRSAPKRVAASFYPLYALALNIAGDVPGMTLICLAQPQDGCLRAYQLSDWDAAVLAGCDAVLMGGRGLESFEDSLTAPSSDLVALVAMDDLQLLNQDAVATGDEDQSHFDTENPWLFLSVGGSQSIAESIAAGLSEIDPGNAELYAHNLERYIGRLDALADGMAALVAPSPDRPVAILHEGLPYLAEELALNVALTIRREPGTYFGDAEMARYIRQMKDAGVEVALVERQAPARLTGAIEAAGIGVAYIDTLSTHVADGDLGGYESAMLANARSLAEALK